MAGQPASVTFSTAIDGQPTIAQGQTAITATRVGQTNEWTFAPVEAGTLVIAATAEGYSSSPWTFDVQPALPEVIKQNNQLVLRNVTTSTAPFTLPPITEPAVYAGTYTITPSQFVAGPVWLVPPSISRSGDVITLRRGLPIWLDTMEPVVRRIEWLRGATLETADLIEGADQTTYTVNPSLDSGGNIWAREVIEDNSGREIASVSNAIAVEAGSWYHPDALVQIDYVGNRARINGTTYATIAEARTAGAIVVDPNGSDTIAVTLGSAYTIAAKATTATSVPNSTQFLQYAVYLDDGEDGDTQDEIAGLVWARTDGGVLYPYLIKAGAAQTTNIASQGAPRVITASSTAFRAAMSVAENATTLSVNGANNGTDTTCLVPTATRLIVGNNAPGASPARKWAGTIAEILIINSAKTGADLEGLLA